MNHDPQASEETAPRSTSASTSGEDDATGLPALGSWRAVYWFVAAVFVVYVALLSVLSRVYA